MADPGPPRTPTPTEANPLGSASAARTFTRSASRRALFEGASGEGTPDTTPPPDMNGTGFDDTLSLGNLSSLTSAIDTATAYDDTNIFRMTPSFGTTPTPADLGKYRRIAEQAGLRGDQADAAIAVAQMTPRTARVQVFSTLTQGVNLLTKLRDAHQKNWEIPSKIKNRMHIVVRLALLAPIPHCYKDELPLLVLRILIKDGTLSKDYETRQEQRAKTIMKEVASYAGHVRSDMKNHILGSIKEPSTYVDTLALTTTLSRPCGKDIKLTKELLGAVAYLRGIMSLQAEGRTAVAVGADRDVWWQLLERRSKDSRERHETLDARAKHLQDWVQEDQVAYGSSNPESLAALAPVSTQLQTLVFDAQFKGIEGLEKDILLIM